MSSKSTAYILPYDASSTSSASAQKAAKLWSSVPAYRKSDSKPPKAGTAHVFYGDDAVTVVSSLGGNFTQKTGKDRREIIRKAVGSAVKGAKDVIGDSADVKIDVLDDPHAAAVAAHLAHYSFTLKTDTPSPFDPRKTPSNASSESITFSPLQEELAQSEEWKRGTIYAQTQNLARTLMELPANMMTPTIFCDRVIAEFKGLDNVRVVVRDEEWAASKNMNTFLSVTRGTTEPAKLLEIHYNGAPDSSQPLAFVGKGVTFDSGGISIKSSDHMKLMRGDMGGAATVVAATLAIAKLKLPVNIVTVTPLTENMPGPSATKPGDIVYAMNGKSIEVEDTDAEGRLILSDAMYYASSEFKPHTLIDVATLTGAMDVALGEVYTGVFCTSDNLWSELEKAGDFEHDRFWRMPIDEEFGPQIYECNADLLNYGGSPGGACTAALFLKPFVHGLDSEDTQQSTIKWAHVDIAGVMEATRETPYMGKGMTGRCVRGLVEYVRQLANQK